MSGMGQASSQGQQDKSDHSQNGEEQNAGDVPIYYHCAPGSSYFEDEMYMREVGDIVDSFYPSVASPAISIPDEEVPDEERPNEAIPDEVTPPGQEANSQTQSDTPPEFLDGAPGPSVTLDPTPSPDASSPPPEPLHDEPSSSTTSTTASTPEEVTLGSPEENPPTNSNSLPESSESASESAVTSDPTPPPGSNPPPPEPLVDEPSSSPSPPHPQHQKN
ncbi:hypothetical protein GLAREA_04079 [Glarea lozoyensis ATCC 20868]|uniref:Uncharacterized protein n=1 Tax=Glarea lozoyensis (strain ATCC 20868 / MF5171) TaxID=1116229 RepID=S3CXP2_GLAL2|nr:uncharacterized protein GLAREA_04079 [Glarea lozoyensis ATCC 20868]EPE31112.1 hypothetical protein GLAREA_04079 [Glarea lozoyensis ATCC 20868]